MSTEHDTFIEKLVAMGVHMEHPDAKAKLEKKHAAESDKPTDPADNVDPPPEA